MFFRVVMVLAAIAATGLPARAAQPVKIASIFAFSGVAARASQPSADGVRFGVEALNRRGGLLGRPVELLEFDNGSTPIGSKIAAERAVSAGVVAIIGASWSSHSLAVAKVAQANAIPMITTDSTHERVTRTGDYIFRACYTDTFQGQVMARFAAGFLKARSAAVLVNSSSDYSIGLADEDLERIFEPFYTKKVLGRSGTGLGMAVVWGAIQDHNGYIDVRSQPGKGTTFDLYFPATRKAVKALPADTATETLAGQGQTILVVDDVAEQREITAQILSHLKYNPIAVESGEKALDFLARRTVPLVILDMIMEPGMDGLETYRRILKQSPGQKAIIASGYAENERVREALDLGASAYLRKPFSLEALGQAIRCELEASRPQTPIADG